MTIDGSKSFEAADVRTALPNSDHTEASADHGGSDHKEIAPLRARCASCLPPTPKDEKSYGYQDNKAKHWSSYVFRYSPYRTIHYRSVACKAAGRKCDRSDSDSCKNKSLNLDSKQRHDPSPLVCLLKQHEFAHLGSLVCWSKPQVTHSIVQELRSNRHR